MNKSRLLAPIADAVNKGELPLGVFNNPALFELKKSSIRKINTQRRIIYINQATLGTLNLSIFL